MKELIQKLKDADEPSRELDAFIAWEVGGYKSAIAPTPQILYAGVQSGLAVPEYTASIDAALALVAEVLPGWTFGVRQQDNKSYYADFQRGFRTSYDKVASGSHPSPAIAILIATLTAIEMENVE